MNEYLNQLQTILETQPSTLPHIWYLLILVVGLIIGSYLNVVVYRGSARYLPEETKYKGKLDTCHPKHSFCPECLHKLAWVENIPLVSWVLQGGKCKHCKRTISIQYPAIEALNASAWLSLWAICQNLGQFFLYAPFFSLLIAATAIDIKTLRIPNSITMSGIALLLLINALTNTKTLTIIILSTIGAGVLGLALVELGKLLFGKKTVKLKNLTAFSLNQKQKFLKIQEEGKTFEESEPVSTEELFLRDSDVIMITGDIDNIANKSSDETYHLEIKKNEASIKIVGKTKNTHTEKIPSHTTISGKIKEITLPQEALGMGDVKLLMLISAAIGFPSFVHAMSLGAICGLAYALLLRLIAIVKKQNAPSMIAFGPWLSVAAIAITYYKILQLP